jgi:hypothetical protein
MPPRKLENARRPDALLRTERTLLVQTLKSGFVSRTEGVRVLNDATQTWIKAEVDAGNYIVGDPALRFTPYTDETKQGIAHLASFLRPLVQGTAEKYQADATRAKVLLPMVKQGQVSLDCRSAKTADLTTIWFLAKDHPLDTLHAEVTFTSLVERVMPVDKSQNAFAAAFHAYFGTGKSSLLKLAVSELKELGLCDELDLVNCGSSDALNDFVTDRPYQCETVDKVLHFLETLFNQVRGSHSLCSQH